MVARAGAALFWIVAGAMHFVIPRQYEAIVPPSLAEWKRELVVASGIAEIAGGLAIVPERTRRGARWWLLATLTAVYPANIHMALHPEQFPQATEAALWIRLPFQFVIGAWAWWATRPEAPAR